MRLSLVLLCVTLLTSCASSGNSFSGIESPSTTASSSAQPSALNNSTAFWQSHPNFIWDRLQQIPPAQLQNMQATTLNPVAQGWLQLALISKQNSNNTPALATRLIAWRNSHAGHAGNAILPDDGALAALQAPATPAHIAVMLPLHGVNSNAGQAVRAGFLDAYYNAADNLKPALSFYDTDAGQPITALYQQSLVDGANTIIGPLTRPHVLTLAQHGSFNLPVIALNYTDNTPPQNFYEMGLAPADEVDALARYARSHGFTRAILIAPANAWGQRVANRLSSQWRDLGGSLADSLYFHTHDNLAEDINRLLQVRVIKKDPLTHKPIEQVPLMDMRRKDFDVIFLLAPPTAARSLMPILKYDYLGNTPVLATSAIYTGTPDPRNDADLDGIIFCDAPWILHANHDGHNSRLFAVGRDAWLMSTQLTRLRVLPNFPLYGATGALTLLPDQRIYRRLPWMKMRNGRPTPA